MGKATSVVVGGAEEKGQRRRGGERWLFGWWRVEMVAFDTDTALAELGLSSVCLEV